MEVLGRHVFERGELVDARIIDQDVELTECLLRLGEEPMDVGLVGDVCLHGDRPAALGGDFRDDAVGARLARAVVNDHGRTLSRQVLRDRRTDPLGGPRDDCNFCSKFRHQNVSPSGGSGGRGES